MSALTGPRGIVSLIAVAYLLTAGPSAAQTFAPNYRETDLRSVIEAVSEVTGRNFLVDQRVTGRVTFFTNTPMSAETFYEAFLAMLSTLNYVAVDDGEFTRIVPDQNMRQYASPGTAQEREALVTQVVRVDNVSAAQLIPILRPMQGQAAHLSAIANTNMIVIVDRLSNVQRLIDVIDVIDRESEEDFEVIRLQYAFAGEIVRTLSSVAQASAQNAGTSPVQIAADERTNSIVLSGSDASRLRFRALVAFLDEPVEGGGDQRVRYLNYADAEELAQRLNEQFGGATPAAAGAAGADGAQPAEGPVSIWAYNPTSALVINAPSRIMQSIMAVIDQLDIPRAQVLVNAMIVEMSEEKAAQLGVSWAIDGSGSDNAIGLTNFGSTSPGIVQLGAAAQGDVPSPAAIPEGGVFAIGRIRDVGTSWAAIVSALRGDGTVNVISEPQIMVLDNDEGESHVGQEVPFLTGSYAQVGQVPGGVNPFSTINREPVGTTLRITPQINQGTGMTLTIELEQSSISASATGAVDLVTNQRRITTSVFAEDGQIVVLGGLIDDQLRQSEQRVPGLGRIPGIGALFRARSTERVKTNLMVFIRPVILRDSLQSEFMTNQRYEYIRQLQLQERERPVRLMREEIPPLLPEFDSERPVPQPPAGLSRREDPQTQEDDGTPDDEETIENDGD